MMKKKKKKEPLSPGAAGPEEVLEGVIEEVLTPAGELERLRAALASEQKLSEENQNRFLKALADLENYKKRAEKERALILEFANEDLLLEVLPVIDNLERALEHTESGKDNLESLASTAYRKINFLGQSRVTRQHFVTNVNLSALLGRGFDLLPSTYTRLSVRLPNKLKFDLFDFPLRLKPVFDIVARCKSTMLIHGVRQFFNQRMILPGDLLTG